MLEAEADGVQPLAIEPDPLGQLGVGAVGEVADAGVPQGSHVHPDLVRTPGLEVDLEQAREAMGLERLVVGDAVLAVLTHGELPVRAGVPPDRGVDRALERVGVALDERVVDLVDLAVPEGVLEQRVGVLALGDHHHSRGADVEPLHDALALRRTASGDGDPGSPEVAHHGRPGPAHRGVYGDPDRLVDHHDVGVVVDHRQPVDQLCHDLERVLHAWQDDVEDRARHQPVGLRRALSVELDELLREQLGRAGAGDAEHAGQADVDALSGQALRESSPRTCCSSEGSLTFAVSRRDDLPAAGGR